MNNRQEQNLEDLNVSLTERLKAITIELQGKNRQLEIEAALEKVRVGATTMRVSSELAETSAVLFQQLNDLNIQAIRTGVGIFDDANDAMEIWLTTFSDSQEVVRILDYVNLHIHPVYENIIPARKQNDPYAVTVLNGEQVRQYYQTMSTYQFLLQPQQFNSQEHFYSFFFPKGAINVISLHSLTEEECHIMIRFSQVFGLIYTRFLDLQKAEAQTREVQIEVALEKIRSSSLAMHHSEEIKNVVFILFEKLAELKVIHGTVAIQLFDVETKDSLFWPGNTLQYDPPKVRLPYDKKMMEKDTCHRDLWDAMMNGKIIFNKSYTKKQIDLWFKYVFGHNDSTNIYPNAREYIKSGEIHTVCFIPEKNSALFADSWDGSLYSLDDLNVLKRTAKVFEQAYIRFLDLQKAEAQVREAQIEAALERVRGRAMAMHDSHELLDAGELLYRELSRLGIVSMTSGYVIMDEEEKIGWIYAASPADGTILPKPTGLPHTNSVMSSIKESWKKQEPFHVVELDAQATVEHHTYLAKNSIDFLFTLEEFLAMSPERIAMHSFNFKQGYILVVSLVRLTSEQEDMVVRFTKVFEMTYRRFLDLQKVETQAREAQIELGLERVRARAMAMQNSDELSALVAVLFEELTRLNLILYRCIIWIFNPHTLTARMWMANSEDKGNAESYYIKKLDHPYYDAILKGWKEKKSKWVYDLQGNDKKTIDQLLLNETELAKLPSLVKEGILSSEHTVVCGSFNNFGLIEASGPEPQSDEQLEIISRFGKVFDLTYTRFNDLKQAEARALEAIKQSSLDRVRAEIASMRTTSDLQRITPIIWQELTMLEVPFFRCGVFIVDEIKTEVKIYLSAPDGHSLGVMQLPFNANSIITNSVDHWRNGLVYTEHWDKEAFVSWMKTMIKQGQIKNAEVYQDSTKPPESLHLHFIPFSQGMLYVGSSNPLPKEKIDLVKSLAEAFSIAYARYEDFNKLEAVKEQIEKTLLHLKQAQSQLIQSEKMASLGELTAGIAHEIQNPLNFVNNFSEVSAEMMDELEKAFVAGNQEGGVALITDIKLNLEKILHHGKRADAIVKGMLQHTRSSTGKKEPTNINALAEEYLRLAYHGLRAKDKMFNATIETHFDSSIGEIDIIPQDIGRVILNLINNAFYAITEKKKEQPEGFEPLVSVFTKKIEDKVSISVKDNGNGIPQQLADKIFQPFFTTKPSGQGTGLGLSLSYDIIKAHGGELQVQTKEGEGSEFIIRLPNVGDY